jgi:hypothetical protein
MPPSALCAAAVAATNRTDLAGLDGAPLLRRCEAAWQPLRAALTAAPAQEPWSPDDVRSLFEALCRWRGARARSPCRCAPAARAHFLVQCALRLLLLDRYHALPEEERAALRERLASWRSPLLEAELASLCEFEPRSCEQAREHCCRGCKCLILSALAGERPRKGGQARAPLAIVWRCLLLSALAVAPPPAPRAPAAGCKGIWAYGPRRPMARKRKALSRLIPLSSLCGPQARAGAWGAGKGTPANADELARGLSLLGFVCSRPSLQGR